MGRHLAGCVIALLWLGPVAARPAVVPQRPVPAIHHVVIVSVDGLRPDLLLRGNTPHAHALMRSGSYTLWARTVPEVYTLPSHVSMLTGVAPSRHGVTWDSHIEQAYSKVPTLFELAKRAGYTTAVAAGKTKFVVLEKPGTLDWSFIGDEDRDRDLDVARHAAAMIRDHRPDVLFVHFGDVDSVGHAMGWGTRQQMLAVARADAAFGIVERALKAGHLIQSTLVIFTADHGGAGVLHPPEDPRSQFIPWIAAGPAIRRNLDLTSVPDLQVLTTATFATVCAFLGVAVDQSADASPIWAILDRPGADLR